MIHSFVPVQFTCLMIFLHNLSPSPLWSTSWSGALHLIRHTFLHPSNVFFSQHMPHHRILFCCSTKIISPIPNLSQLFTWDFIFYLNMTHPSDHFHICSLKCHLVFFPDRPSLICAICRCADPNKRNPKGYNRDVCKYL